MSSNEPLTDKKVSLVLINNAQTKEIKQGGNVLFVFRKLDQSDPNLVLHMRSMSVEKDPYSTQVIRWSEKALENGNS